MSQQKIPVVDVTNDTSSNPVTAKIWDPDNSTDNLDALPSESRRKFLKNSAGVTTASLVGPAALVTGTDDANANTSWAEHFQANYRLMTEEEKEEAEQSSKKVKGKKSKQFQKPVPIPKLSK